MRYKLSLLVFLLGFVSGISVAQYTAVQTSLAKDNLLKDMDIYRDSITAHHVDPFAYISRKEFNRSIEKIKKSAANYNADEMLAALMKLNADIKDEQTGLSFENPLILPLQAYWFEEGIFVLKTDDAHSNMIGGKIVSIDGTPIKEIIERIKTVVPAENEQSYKKAIPEFIISPNILHGLDIISSNEHAKLTIVTKKGDTISATLTAKTPINIKFDRLKQRTTPLKYSGGPRDYWYKYDSTEQYIYFECLRTANNKRIPYKDFEKELLDEISSKNPKKLIIDLRDNGIGNEDILKTFIEQLSKLPINEKGRIYVLVGRRTFLFALQEAFELKDLTKAIFVGEETSGGKRGFGITESFDLPNTKLKLSYTIKRYENSYTESLKPDITIGEKFSDFENGTDAVLNYVLEQK
ncbi:MAG TPA: hypothetical protein VN721_07855 [Flavipsychrobacter sp.]|nr:hypothetical protein [Flavipsychrobacter sp.]